MTADQRVIELTMTATTADDIWALAEVLRGEEDDPRATLMEDALRTYVWVVRRQAQGCRIVALPEAASAHLATSTDIPDGKAEVLVPYIPDGKTDLLPSWLLKNDEARP
jgi:hypothetical protein